MLSQLLLPAAHAQSMAGREGNPLLLALCGSSPQLLAEFRKTASPELLKQLAESPRNGDNAPCGHTSIASSVFVLPSSPAMPDWSGWRHVRVATVDRIDHSAFRARLPQARAPPEFLDFETHALLQS
ncbi:MAG: hypothetical protein M3O62_15200 [Pseudomonadota bacterium]|nr:hypothetical protein [Pseudomonadota bacterium]